MAFSTAGATHSSDPESQLISLSARPGPEGTWFVQAFLNDHSGALNDMSVHHNGVEIASASAVGARLNEVLDGDLGCNEFVARMESPSAFLEHRLLIGPTCAGHAGIDGPPGGAALAGPIPTDAADYHYRAASFFATSDSAAFSPEPANVGFEQFDTTTVVAWDTPSAWCGSVVISGTVMDPRHGTVDVPTVFTASTSSSECGSEPPCEDPHKGLGLGHQQHGDKPQGHGQGHEKHHSDCQVHPGNHDPAKLGQGHQKFG